MMIDTLLYWFPCFCSHSFVATYYEIDDLIMTGLGGPGGYGHTVCFRCSNVISNTRNAHEEKLYNGYSRTLKANIGTKITRDFVQKLLQAWHSSYSEEEYTLLVEWIKENHPFMPIEE